MKLTLLTIVTLYLSYVHSAKILGVFPMEWGSHYILGSKLMKGLAEAGHDVTFISPRKTSSPPKNGSWTDVVLEGSAEEFQSSVRRANLYTQGQQNVLEKLKGYAELTLFISNVTLWHPNVQKLLRSSATFDAIILAQLMNDCHHIFAHHFKAPLILLSSIGPNPFVNSKIGNPSSMATIAHLNFQIDPSVEMTFIERLQNVFHHILCDVFFHVYILSRHELFLRGVVPEVPHIYDLRYNTALVLLNSHTSLTEAVPVVPNMVEIGGYHIDPPQKLPQDLQTFLDDAKDGAIYFSMGSLLKSKEITDTKKKTLLAVFKKLKYKVLWKYEDDLTNKSDNILIRKWMPQQDILAHPNINLFITHGGLLSATETIYHGVPVLSIPVFADQEMNALKAVRSGFGLKLSYNDENFNEETLYNLIQELLNNPEYTENAKRISRIYHDRPMTPMQSAVYWVEYIIRHKGAPHLRVAGVGMPWYKYYMIDVAAVLLGCSVVVLYCLRFIFHMLLAFFKNSVKQKIH